MKYLVGANRRLVNAKSSMLRPGIQPGRGTHARTCTYVHTYFIISVCTKEKAQHDTARHRTAKTTKIQTKSWKEKRKSPSLLM